MTEIPCVCFTQSLSTAEIGQSLPPFSASSPFINKPIGRRLIEFISLSLVEITILSVGVEAYRRQERALREKSNFLNSLGD